MREVEVWYKDQMWVAQTTTDKGQIFQCSSAYSKEEALEGLHQVIDPQYKPRREVITVDW